MKENDHMKQRLISVMMRWIPDASNSELMDIIKLMREDRLKKGLNINTPRIFHLSNNTNNNDTQGNGI